MENKIMVYGQVNCPQCEEVKSYLNENGINYTYIDDKIELMKNGSKYRKMSAPVIVFKEKGYSGKEFVEFIETSQDDI